MADKFPICQKRHSCHTISTDAVRPMQNVQSCTENILRLHIMCFVLTAFSTLKLNVCFFYNLNTVLKLSQNCFTVKWYSFLNCNTIV